MESNDQPQDIQDNDNDVDVIEDNNNEVSSSPSSSSTVTSGQQPTTSRVLSPPDQEGLPPVPVASSSPVLKQNQVPVVVANPVQSNVPTTTTHSGGTFELDIIEEWARRKTHEKSAVTETRGNAETATDDNSMATAGSALELLAHLGGSTSNQGAIDGPSQPEETPVAVASSSTAHQQQPQEAPRKEAPDGAEERSPIISKTVKRRLQYEETEEDQAVNDQDIGGDVQGTHDQEAEENTEAARPVDVEVEVTNNDEGTNKSKTKARKKRISSTKRSGLVLSVSRINRRLKAGRYARRTGFTAGVYMAAVLEYLVAEVLELAGNCARYFKKQRIFPRCIQLTLLHDKELYQLTRGAIVPQGGVKPFIHPALTGFTGVQTPHHIIDEGDKDILQSNFG